MKKFILLLPLALISCKKEASVAETKESDSAALSKALHPTPVDSVLYRDSIVNNAPATRKVLQQGVMRSDEGSKIVREVDASALPFSLGEEFSKDHHELVLKITDFEDHDISAVVVPKDKNMNIRISQIILPDGRSDGPFGREVNKYKLSSKGDVTFVISKSTMASGNEDGSFTIRVE